MTSAGRWGLSQQIDDEWESTGSLGFSTRDEAEREVQRLDAIQAGRWRVRDRRPAAQTEAEAVA